MSTASLSLEPSCRPLILVALRHWGREVPGPLVGQRAQSVPSLTLALTFQRHCQSQMWPASRTRLEGLANSEVGAFPSPNLAAGPCCHRNEAPGRGGGTLLCFS